MKYKKIPLTLYDIRDLPGGMKIAGPHHGIGSAEIDPNQFPIKGLGFLNELNVIRLVDYLAVIKQLEVGFSNEQVRRKLKDVPSEEIELLAIGSKSCISELAEELFRREVRKQNLYLSDMKFRVDSFRGHDYYSEATLHPTFMWGAFQLPIHIEMYNRDLLKK